MSLTKVSYSMITGAQYNVLDYGADSSGVADSAAAIQTAINAAFAAGGGSVYIPSGSYKLTTNLTLKSNVSIFGNGTSSKLVPTVAVTIDILSGISIANVTYSDFYIDCSATATPGPSGISINGFTDSEISGVTVYNSAWFGWLIFGSVRCKYLRNTINITRKYDGMTITTGSVDNVIEGNTVINSYDSGIGFTDTLGTTCVGNYVKRQKIAGNWFAPGIDAAGAKNAVISGNFVLGNKFGISVLQHPNSGKQPKRVTVTGNTVGDGEYGVIVGPVAVVPPAVSEATTRDGIVISGNSIYAQDVQGIAIVGLDSLSVAISGNQISYSATGIGLDTTTNPTLTANTIFNNTDGINTFGNSNVNLNLAFNIFESNTNALVGGTGTGSPYVLHNKNLAYPLGTLAHENFASQWDFGGQLRLGGYYLWVDATGDLRIKFGAPTSDTDGVVVGTQT